MNNEVNNVNNQVNNTTVPNNNVIPPQTTPAQVPQSTQPSVAQPTPMPATPSSVVKPTPMPAPAGNVVNPTQLSSQPAQVPPIPSAANQELTVVNTTKKRTSNIILIIFLILMILVVFNIDTVLKYYDNYMKTGSLTKDTNEQSTDNLVSGYILINDNSSSMKVNNINFYNFRKKNDTMLTFNYESSNSFDDPKAMNVYVELYNSEKVLIYKGLFNPNEKIERDSVRLYSIELDNYVYSEAFYALIKKYNSGESNKASMTCTFSEDSVSYKIVYNFENEMLINYTVNKELLDNNKHYKTEITDEYNSVSKYISATYDNNKLNYSVDLSNSIAGFNPLYEYGTVKVVIKNKEELKKWNCE